MKPSKLDELINDLKFTKKLIKNWDKYEDQHKFHKKSSLKIFMIMARQFFEAMDEIITLDMDEPLLKKWERLRKVLSK